MRILTTNKAFLGKISVSFRDLCDEYPLDELVNFDFSTNDVWKLAVLELPIDVGMRLNFLKLLNEARFNIPVIGLLDCQVDDLEKMSIDFVRSGGLYLLRKNGPIELLYECINIAHRLQIEHSKAIVSEVTSWTPEGATFVLNMMNHTFLLNGEKIVLSFIEKEILRLLLSRPERVFSRGEILSACWKEPDIIDRTVDTHIGRIKRKLGVAGRYIQTVRSAGYKLSADKC